MAIWTPPTTALFRMTGNRKLTAGPDNQDIVNRVLPLTLTNHRWFEQRESYAAEKTWFRNRAKNNYGEPFHQSGPDSSVEWKRIFSGRGSGRMSGGALLRG